MPYPLPLTRTEAYLAYKAGVIQQSDLKPSLAVPRNGIDAWLAYWTGLTTTYPVKNVGKNLFNGLAYAENSTVNADGDILPNNNYDVYKVAVKPNAEYAFTDENTYSGGETGIHGVAFAYDDSVIGEVFYRKRTTTGVFTNVFVAPARTSYILISCRKTDQNIQLEEGSAATAYEPYTGEPLILQEEEAYIAYLCGVIDEYPEKCLRRVGAYLRYLISARWGRPDHPLNREELYLSLIKTQVIPSGDPSSDIEIDGTAKAAFQDVKMYGDTFQQTYTGKNLMISKATTQEKTGVTITPNRDGSFTLNGTATATTDFYFAGSWNNKTISYLDMPSGDYTISLLDSNKQQIASPKFRVELYDRMGENSSRILWLQQSLPSPQTTTVSSPAQVTCSYISIPIDQSFTNEKFYIQLEKRASATSFEPYVGGTYSPNPDYPQPIQTVTGRQVVTVAGKNKYPFSDVLWSTTSTTTGWRFQNGDGNAYGATITDKTDYKLTLPAGTYTMTAFDLSPNIINIQACTNGESAETIVTYPANINSENLSSTITLAETTTLCVRYRVTNPSLGIGNTKIQIEKGSTATAYEPYSSNDYEINLGKNLFDVTATPWSKGIAYNAAGDLVYWNGYVGIVGYQPVEPETTYTFSNSLGKGFYYGLVFYDKDKTKISNITVGTKTFTTPKNCKFIRFAIGNDVTEKPTWTQIELGSNATAYAPYFDPIELCRIAYSTTVFQDYIYKDVDGWKIHKATATKRFSGADSEGWIVNLAGTENYYYRCPRAATGSYGTPDNARYLFCNYESGAQITTSNTVNGIFILSGGDVRFRSGVEMSIESWKAKLAATNMELYYALSTPTDTVITNQALINQLNALKQGGAENGTTYIKVNATDPNLPGLLYVEAPKYE